MTIMLMIDADNCLYKAQPGVFSSGKIWQENQS